MADINIGQIAATTLRNRSKTLADNVTNHNALLKTLSDKGHIKDAAGGRTIVENLIYAENGTAKFYDGYETFTVTDQDVIDAAEYDWKQLGGFVTMSGLEQVKNSGKHAVLDLLEGKIKALQATLKNAAATSIYSDGTGTSGKEFGGLQLLVADNPAAAGTVGGIDQVANTFWRNQFDDHTADGSSTTAAQLLTYMNNMWLATIRGSDKPDILAADSVSYRLYEDALQPQQRFTTSKLADAGFENLKYKGASVVYDDQAPANHMYFLNTDYLFMRKAPNRWFDVGDARTIQTADYEVVPVWLAGNLTCSNRQRQGVIIVKP